MIEITKGDKMKYFTRSNLLSKSDCLVDQIKYGDPIK